MSRADAGRDPRYMSAYAHGMIFEPPFTEMRAADFGRRRAVGRCTWSRRPLTSGLARRVSEAKPRREGDNDQ